MKVAVYMRNFDVTSRGARPVGFVDLSDKLPPLRQGESEDVMLAQVALGQRKTPAWYLHKMGDDGVGFVYNKIPLRLQWVNLFGHNSVIGLIHPRDADKLLTIEPVYVEHQGEA